MSLMVPKPLVNRKGKSEPRQTDDVTTLTSDDASPPEAVPITEREQVVLQALKANPYCSLADIARDAKITRERVRQLRNSLTTKGLLRRQPEYVPVEAPHFIQNHPTPSLDKARALLRDYPLTAQQLADELGHANRQTVYRWAQDGLIDLKPGKRGRPRA